MLGLEEPAGERVIVALRRIRIDVDAQDECSERDTADPGGEPDADPGGGDQRQADATRDRNQSEQADAEVRAGLAHCGSMRQQAATWSALSSSSACASSSILITR